MRPYLYQFLLEDGCVPSEHSLFLKAITLFSEINKSSSDDQPSLGICESKYVEDAKAARSVRVWDRVPIKINRHSLFLRDFSL